MWEVQKHRLAMANAEKIAESAAVGDAKVRPTQQTKLELSLSSKKRRNANAERTAESAAVGIAKDRPTQQTKLEERLNGKRRRTEGAGGWGNRDGSWEPRGGRRWTRRSEEQLPEKEEWRQASSELPGGASPNLWLEGGDRFSKPGMLGSGTLEWRSREREAGAGRTETGAGGQEKGGGRQEEARRS